MWSLGDFDLTISFVDGMARAMAVKRRRGPMSALSPAELASILALNAPASLWTIQSATPVPSPTSKSARTRPSRRINEKGPHQYFSYAEREAKAKDRITQEIFGFSPGGAPFAFFYLPVVGDGPPVLPSEASLIGKLR